MAAELESQFSEDSELIKSSGGVFEIEDNGELIFSKSKLGRFPEDDEIANIIHLTANGSTISDAQTAASKASKGVSFADWLAGFLTRKAPKTQ